MNIIDEVLTTPEAARRRRLSQVTVKQACSGQKGDYSSPSKLC
ncbi:helix-turn-helix domain-containing protein [uncultured Megasphaera sp.]